MTQPIQIIKPVQKSYVLFSVFSILFSWAISLIGTVVLSIIFTPLLLLLGGLLSLFFLYLLINLFVSYKKERYELFADRIIRHGGGIFSQFQSELILNNVTNISHLRPFLLYTFFKTSHIRIESAGSSLSQIRFSHIHNGFDIFDSIQGLLQQNGFSLSKQKIHNQEQPNTIAILLELVSQTIGILFFLIFFLITIGTGAIIGLFELLQQQTLLLILTLFGITILLAFLLVRFVLSFLHRKMRVYTVYDDVVHYEEGFLTKYTEYIPVENIADASLNQTLLDRIIKTYTIVISCQGSQNKVIFSNVPNGDALQQSISHIAKKTASLSTKSVQTKTVTTKKRTQKTIPKGKGDILFQTKMHAFRKVLQTILVSFFLLIFPPLWPFLIIAIVYVLIRIFNTTYTITDKSIIEHFSFIQKKRIEFQNSRITTVIYREDILDKLFNTCSLEFWSIGSQETITFSFISKDERVLQYLKKTLNFADEKKGKVLHPSFSIFAFIVRYLTISILLPIAIILLIAFSTVIGSHAIQLLFIGLAILLPMLYLSVLFWQYLKARRTNITMYETYLVVTKGVIVTKQFIVLYENIKGKTDLQYPLTTKGTIHIDIAGERSANSQNAQSTAISNSVSIPYMADCFEDPILLVKDKTLYTVKPKYANAIVLSCITIIGILFIPIVIWYLHVKSFELREKRIVQKSGLIYKKKKQIYYSMIDHIDSGQGMLHKLFSNGRVFIYTTGSSSFNMNIGNITEYKQFSKDLSSLYK